MASRRATTSLLSACRACRVQRPIITTLRWQSTSKPTPEPEPLTTKPKRPPLIDPIDPIDPSKQHHDPDFRPTAHSRGLAAVAIIVGLWIWTIVTKEEFWAEEPPEIVFEKSKKKKGQTKEQIRETISSQHLQVRRSWENPGVYAWGSNVGRVAAPDSEDAYVKSPRRMKFFDGQILRDIKLDSTFGAAIAENGDLYQWGTAYASNIKEPVKTLKGRDLKSLAISKDRVLALSSSGTVYSIPVSKEDQETGPKIQESSWLPFWSTSTDLSFRLIRPELGYSEKIVMIAAGLEHALMATSTGRVFSAAASSSAYPSKGQLGIPGLMWENRPTGSYDQPHELTTLKGFNIKSLAAGDFHSMVLDSEGRIFVFGDNSTGQLAQEINSEIPYVDAPSLVSLNRMYAGSSQFPTVTSISAGGLNSAITVAATQLARPGEPSTGKITADTFMCGQGIVGQLGAGRWIHVQGTPLKIKPLSGLFEYDEVADKVIPISLASINIGSNHTAAVLKNVTYLDATSRSSENDTNWGADVLWWGGNEYYQLGTGKRNNISTPSYIGPLDGGEGGEKRDAHRFHLTPRKKVNIGGRNVFVEQRIECGRYVTAVYSGT